VGRLLRVAIQIYGHFRTSFPESGPPPRFGGSMIRFIGFCLTFCGAAGQPEATIKEVWNSRRSWWVSSAK
jgi:hypothetical protein